MRLFGFEAGGEGIESGRHAAKLSVGSSGVLHGARSYLLQDDEGQTIASHSISAGLDYPSVGPEHAWLRDTGKATYESVTDVEAMDAFALLSRTEESSLRLSQPMQLLVHSELASDSVLTPSSWSTCLAEATRMLPPQPSGSTLLIPRRSIQPRR